MPAGGSGGGGARRSTYDIAMLVLALIGTISGVIAAITGVVALGVAVAEPAIFCRVWKVGCPAPSQSSTTPTPSTPEIVPVPPAPEIVPVPPKDPANEEPESNNIELLPPFDESEYSEPQISGEIQRLELIPDGETTTLEGSVGPDEEMTYVFSAEVGQVVTVLLNGQAPVALDILGPGLDDTAKGIISWQSIIQSTEDHYIQVWHADDSLESHPYRLEIRLATDP